MISGFNHIDLGKQTLEFNNEESTANHSVFEKIFSEPLDVNIFNNGKPAIVECDIDLSGFREDKYSLLCSNVAYGLMTNIIVSEEGVINIMTFILTTELVRITISSFNAGE